LKERKLIVIIVLLLLDLRRLCVERIEPGDPLPSTFPCLHSAIAQNGELYR
jgi:hypothetical protein